MKKHLFSLLALAAMLAANGAPISPEQALQAVARNGSARKIATGAPTLVYTTSEADKATTYMFNSPSGGFMLLSADDAVPEILLGYSDSGSFDASDIPAGLAAMLDLYSHEIATLADAAAPSRPAIRISRPAIAPQCATRWNQGEPYNLMCPTDAGGRSVTGCVATAMAQVMKYHEWPETSGQGSHSYDWNGTTLSIDFADVPFYWDLMLDSYNGGETTAQKSAVARLMKACGYSVDMDYSSNSSGASGNLVAGALIDYFGYSPAIVNLPRGAVKLSEFESRIYESLNTSGPVFFTGQNSQGGHAFVCDGYQGNGYFHINWGWGGMSDGYFLLTALDPSNQGIGGSASGYNFGQTVTLNIRPARDGDEESAPIFYSDNVAFSIDEDSAYLGESLTWHTAILHSSFRTITFSPVLKITSAVDDTDVIYTDALIAAELPPGYYYPLLDLDAPLPSDLADGDYYITGAVEILDQEYIPTELHADILYAEGLQSTYTMTVDNGMVSIQAIKPVYPEIVLTGFNLETLFAGKPFTACGSVYMPVEGYEYSSDVTGLLNNGYGNWYIMGSQRLNVTSTTPEDFIFSDNMFDGISGTTEYCIAKLYTDGNQTYIERILSNVVPVSIRELGSGTISSSQVYLDNTASSYTQPVTVDCEGFNASIDVTCTSGEIYDSFAIYLMRDGGDGSWYSVDAAETPMVYLQEGAKETLSVDMTVGEEYCGQRLAALIRYDNNWVDADWSFLVPRKFGLVFNLKDIILNSTESNPETELPMVDRNNIKVTATLECTSGTFDDTLTATLMSFGPEGWTPIDEMETRQLYAPKGYSETFDLVFSIPEADPKTIYALQFNYGDEPCFGRVEFQVLEIETGIGLVDADAAATVEYYNLQGIRVDNPSHGVFIRRCGTSTAKIVL